MGSRTDVCIDRQTLVSVQMDGQTDGHRKKWLPVLKSFRSLAIAWFG